MLTHGAKLKMLSFTIHHNDHFARRGTLTTRHGTVETPCFMPVGTAGTVKAMTVDDVAKTGAEILLGNTYHLMLRPTAERIERFGGLHKFMNWDKPILTDSGGYQVMSLSKLRKIREEGVTFSSHIDGSSIMLTPERSIEIQHKLDSNITMCFDECTAYPASHHQAKESMELSMRWAKRSKHAFIDRDGYGLFGIMQGSVFKDLRQVSMDSLNEISFDGIAIGGLAVGEGQKIMLECLDFITPMMPHDKPRYLMGVGKPSDILEAVIRGVDMFDCVLPTRSGRNGQLFTRFGTINIKNARYKDDPNPIDSSCSCPACKNYSRAYLHHLHKAKEILGVMLMTQHNLTYYQDLMQQMRKAIVENNLLQVSQSIKNSWVEGKKNGYGG